MNSDLAQRIVLPTIPGQPTIAFEGPIPTKAGGGYRFETLADIISLALRFLFPIAGFLLFILIVIGGFQFLTSGGDPKKMEVASKRITNAVIGFILLIAAYSIVKIVNKILSPTQPFF